LLGNPAVPIVIGGLVKPDIAFLNALYANGIKGNYDGISIHPYGIELSPTKLGAFRAAQRSVGDSAPLWISEFGAPTSLNSGWKVTEAGQADAIKHDFGVLDALPYVTGATLYSLRDTSNDRYDFIANFGVLRLDFSPKQGWAALRTALHWQPPTKKAKKQQPVSCRTLRRSASARRRASKVRLRRCGLSKKRAKSRRR
jgi:hypothetical protein